MDGENTFIGDYRVVKLLGVGGMGEVYLVAHPRLPRLDALKLLPDSVSRNPQFRSRFTREADLLAPLRHQNIITVYDRGEHDGRLWLAMEFVDGYDAAKLLRSDGVPPLDMARAIIAGAGAALDYAYAENRITHRDVKPANILVEFGAGGRLKTVKLADFGIAKAVGESTSLTSTGVTVGTMAYISPEAIEGRALDNRSDLYSLGCTAFELLTGRPPFTATTMAALMMAHVSQPAPAITTINRTLPAHFDDVFARVLDKDPHARFQSCEEFVEALCAAPGVTVPAAPAGGGTDRFQREAAWAPTQPAAKHVAAFESNGHAAGGAGRQRRALIAGGAGALLTVAAMVLVWRPWTVEHGAAPPAATASSTLSPSTSATAVPSPPSLAPPSSTPAATTQPAVACGVDNDAEPVRAAMASMSGPGGWGSGGLNQAEGNFDPCATLSTVLVYHYGAAGGSPEQALLFHKGQYVGTATQDAYSYMRLNKQQTSDSTVVLDFRLTPGTCGACDDADYVPIKFRWTGDKVEMVGSPPDRYRAGG